MSDPIQMLRVTAKKAGRRRAGREWPGTPVEVPAAQFSDTQIIQLIDDPELIVQAFEQFPERVIDDSPDDNHDGEDNASGGASSEPDNTTTADRSGQEEPSAAKDGGKAVKKTSGKKTGK